MAGGKIFNGGVSGGGGGGSGSDGSVSSLLLRNQASEPPNNFLISGSSSSGSPSFAGPRSMVNFKDGGRRSGSTRLIFCPFDDKENGEDEMDEFLLPPEKKRRLTADQVQLLEKSFEQENKLEPDRKTQLAKEIGLQPRQVAIWFQNRRARWKTKQLEKDFEVLQSNYDTLKAEHENLLHEKDKLRSEALLLSEKLLVKKKEDKGILEFEEPPLMERSDLKEEEEESIVMNLSCKVEEASSVKSDIFHSDKSDTSNEEEDSLENTIFPPYIFPKLEDDDYSDQPPTSSGSFGFPGEDNAFWSWSY